MLSRALRRAGGERDPNFGQVALLLPFDDDFNDRGPNRFTPTLIGSPTLVSDGGGAGAFWGLVGSFDGSQRLEFANNAAFQIGTGDFTIELNFRCYGAAGTYGLASHGVASSNGWQIRLNSNGSMDLVYGASSTFAIAPSGFVDFGLSSRYYVKVLRDVDGFRACRGKQPGSGPFYPPDNWTFTSLSGPTANSTNLNTSATLYIAGNRNGAQMFNGEIEEFRLTVGHARMLNARQTRPWPQK